MIGTGTLKRILRVRGVDTHILHTRPSAQGQYSFITTKTISSLVYPMLSITAMEEKEL